MVYHHHDLFANTGGQKYEENLAVETPNKQSQTYRAYNDMERDQESPHRMDGDRRRKKKGIKWTGNRKKRGGGKGLAPRFIILPSTVITVDWRYSCT